MSTSSLSHSRAQVIAATLVLAFIAGALRRLPVFHQILFLVRCTRWDDPGCRPST